MTWQKRLRFALGVFVVALGGVIFFAIRTPERAAPSASTPRHDPKAVVESTRGVLTQAKGASREFRLEYDRLLSYADGATRLEGVKVIVLSRGGRDFVLTAREGRVSQDQTSVEVSGAVQLEASDGLTVSSEAATYDDREGAVRTADAVRFARGRMSGSGRGASYDRTHDVLQVLADARVTVTPDDQGAGGLTIASSSATFARREHQMRFDGAVRMERAGAIIEADAATVRLTEDDQRIQSMDLRGHSRIARPATSTAPEQRLSAQDMDLTYASGGDAIERAVLNREAVVDLAGANGSAGRRLSADSMDLGFSPDGATMTALAARGTARVTLPPQDKTGARTIQSSTLEASGEPGRGLTQAAFRDQVVFRETTPATKSAPASERVVHSKMLQLAMASNFDTIQEAHFTGDVVIEDGSLTARAPDARYDVARGVVLLTADAGPPPILPRIIDRDSTIEARRIEVTLEGRSLRAENHVESLFRSAEKGSGGASAARAAGKDDGVRRRGLIKREEPAHVEAEQLAYDGPAERAEYTGGARLWQGETVIQADTLILDERTGDLHAKGSVRTVQLLTQQAAGAEKPERVSTIASAEDLVYDEAKRRATYTTKAHVNGPQGDLTADRIELYLDEAREALERAEAYGVVTLREPARSATGTRLTYFSADERYVMSGTPVRIVEECRETTGKTLTFFKSTDTIAVDGNEEIRTQTKAGKKCPEPQ